MNDEVREDLQKAINYSFLLLKYRARSEAELRLRLKRKKFAPDITEAAVSFLKAKKFIDDEDFARIWLESRIKESKGLRRIRQELKAKGVNDQIIKKVEIALKDYDEQKTVFAIAKKRLSRIKGLPIQKKRQRLYGWLLRRGFLPDTVIDTLNKLLPNG